MGYLQAAFLSGMFFYLLLLIGSVVHFGEDVVALAAASIMENDERVLEKKSRDRSA